MLVSVIYQHESAIGIHISLSSGTSLPSPTPSHPSRLSRALSLSSLPHAANSQQVSILHMVMYMFQCYSLSSSHPVLPFRKFLSHSVHSAVTQSCLTLCDPMDYSTPGLPVHHQLPECAQTHVHQVSDAIQPSHPLSSPSPPAFNLAQHQGLFK